MPRFRYIDEEKAEEGNWFQFAFDDGHIANSIELRWPPPENYTGICERLNLSEGGDQKKRGYEGLMAPYTPNSAMGLPPRSMTGILDRPLDKWTWTAPVVPEAAQQTASSSMHAADLSQSIGGRKRGAEQVVKASQVAKHAHSASPVVKSDEK